MRWVIVGIAIAVRVWAARGDLWLDEILSLERGLHAPSWLAVFTSLHSDNNHYLTTLWLRLLGEGRSPLLYRLPSLLAGAGTLAVVARRESISALILFAASFMLVQYDSEARGYALLVSFAVACFELAKAERGALFSICAVLGLLSHPTFLFALAGFAVWKWRRPAWFLAPVAISALFIWLDWSVMVYAGGTPEPLSETLRRLLRATLGLPRGPLELLAIPALGAALVALARSKERAFHAALFLATAAGVALQKPDFLAPRYFLVCVPFFLFLLADLPWAGVAALVLLNGAEIVRLDRGHPREVVEYMAAHTPGATVTVSSDHKFRNWTVLGYYARAQPKKFEYIEEGARWYVTHEFGDDPNPPVRGYSLVLRTPWSGLSGWRCFLFLRK